MPTASSLATASTATTEGLQQLPAGNLMPKYQQLFAHIKEVLSNWAQIPKKGRISGPVHKGYTKKLSPAMHVLPVHKLAHSWGTFSM